MPICFRFAAHEIVRALALARLSAGSSIPARMAMIAITTRSSISVKYELGDLNHELPAVFFFILFSFR